MLSPGTAIGKYLVLDSLGSGHFGTVYKVLDRGLSVERALKVLPVADPTQFVELFEAQIQYKCRHDNCVTVNAADVAMIGSDLHAIIDMEMIAGGSVEAAISKDFLSCKRACNVICDASYGLEHAHTQGVLHKDIKPGNILLDHGVAKIADFGISESVSSPSMGSGMAYTTHQPPEFFSSGSITVQSDVYSMGVTLFRCLNNIRDWRGTIAGIANLNQSLAAGTLIKDIGWRRWVPDKVRRITSKACAPEPVKRFSSVRQFRQALERLSWSLDWRRTGPFEWSTQNGAAHTAKLTGIGLDTFEHLINARRRKAETQTFPNTALAVDHLLSFVAKTTLSD